MKWRKNRSYRLTRHPQYWGKEGNSALKRVLATRMASRMKKPSSHTQTEETSQAARTGEVSEKQLACPSSEPKDNRRHLCDPRTQPSNTGIRPTSVHKCEKVKPSYSREEEKVPVRPSLGAAGRPWTLGLQGALSLWNWAGPSVSQAV